jgi:hypothetical protein
MNKDAMREYCIARSHDALITEYNNEPIKKSAGIRSTFDKTFGLSVASSALLFGMPKYPTTPCDIKYAIIKKFGKRSAYKYRVPNG